MINIFFSFNTEHGSITRTMQAEILQTWTVKLA